MAIKNFALTNELLEIFLRGVVTEALVKILVDEGQVSQIVNPSVLSCRRN